tara:strand:+ start:220 stop:738 length:519 start_codon:yes stop_codon:yes gene_type:complete
MNLNEIAINYYHNSLALAQKALISGIAVSAIAYLSVITGTEKASYTIPIVNLEIESLSSFSISLLGLFFACGMVCLYGMNKALFNWKLISDHEISERLLYVPNILMSGRIYKSFLYGGLFTVGASLSAQIFNIGGSMVYLAGFFVCLPYFFAFGLRSDFRTLARTGSKGNTN